jgi:polyisoprenoid-binding protein YceI
MKFKSALIAISAVALLAACGQPAVTTDAKTDAAVASGPVDLKAPTGVYNLDPTHANLTWSVPHNNISSYTARFNTYAAKLTLDAANLENSAIEVTIDPASVDANYPGDYAGTHAQTGYKSWNDDLAKAADKLNASAFPQITFKSTTVKKTGDRTADVTGDLTFLGVTKPVTLKATFNGEIDKHPFMQVPAIGFSAEGSFKRSDFGQPAGFVGDDVTIKFDGEFIQEAATAPAA